ncbi:MAG: MFS transporter [Sedimentisphaerales bacterium]|nr:MFS transporter [Sedimentisphaerales bacterium]
MATENVVTAGIFSTRSLRRRTMRLSIIEGGFAIVMLALVDTFYIPYLNEMGATEFQIGMAVSLPALLGGMMQIFTPWALGRFGSRKKVALTSVLTQAAAFIPFGLFCHLQTEWRIWPAIAAFLVSSVGGSLGAATWADWMADIVPRRRRGQFFGFRNRLLGVIQMATAVLAGYILDHLTGKVLLAFTAIWFFAFIFRTVSGLLHLPMYEPLAKKAYTTSNENFLTFLGTLGGNSFGRFALATALLSVAVNFSGPFFALHMLNNLQLTYTRYVILSSVATASTIVFMGIWGRVIDRVGTVSVMRLCSMIIVFIPLPWVMTENYYILIVAQILSGLSWAGFNLAAFVYYLDSTRSMNRVRFIAYFNALNSLGAFFGATLGGWAAPYLPALTTSHSPLQTIFLISSIGRFLPGLLFQTIKVLPSRGRLSAVERLFFDPRLRIRTGVIRSVTRHFKRGL